MQKAHFAVRACKRPVFIHRRIGLSVKICGNSGLPCTVVPCLHQCNLYMKRKLPEWRTQKCYPCFGAESPLRSTGLLTTGFHASPFMAVLACKFAETRRIPFTVVPWLHQCNLCMERKLLEWRTQKCNPCFGAESPLRSTGLQTTGFHASPYRAVSVNLRKLGATFHRGTVFASMQSIYEKEAAGMENPKM